MRTQKTGGVNVWRVVRKVLLLAAVLVAVAACASKGLPPSQRLANTQPQGGDSADSDSGGGSEPADPEAARKQITELYSFIFNGANPQVDEKLAKVDQGASVRDSFLKALNANKATFDAITSKVDKIEFTSPTEAKTTFTILVSGQPTLEGFEGKAVYKNGQWMLAASGLCDLVALADSSLPCTPSGP
ncbi:MAG: hypothetical protein K1X95_07465 [Acidimicrobiia bacterium]|nr:hypothetical protein [Acidimicrobiia bacterium]